MSALAIAAAKLTALTAVTALVGTRIYSVSAPQNAVTPYIVMNLVSEPDPEILSGSGQCYLSRVQFECIADSAKTANDVGEALKGMTSAIKQTVAGRTDVDILKTEVDFTEPGDERQRSRRICDYLIRWR